MCPGLKAGDRVTRRGKRSEASQIHLGLRGGRCAEEGPGGGGHDAGRGWNSNASRWVRICANKGVKDIFGEPAGKGPASSSPRKKKTQQKKEMIQPRNFLPATKRA